MSDINSSTAAFRQGQSPLPYAAKSSVTVGANALATGGAGPLLWATSPVTVGGDITYAAGTGVATINRSGLYSVEFLYQNTNTGAITLELQNATVYIPGTRVDCADDASCQLSRTLQLSAGATIRVYASAATTSESNTDSVFIVRRLD